MSIVYVGGTFDALHFGHINFLRQADKIGKVIVALNTDEFINEYKGHPPLLTYVEREKALLGCRYVHGVVRNIGGADSKPSIMEVDPDFVAVGTDWASKDYYKQMQFTQEWLDDRDITLVYIPYTQGISTTELKRRLKMYDN